SSRGPRGRRSTCGTSLRAWASCGTAPNSAAFSTRRRGRSSPARRESLPLALLAALRRRRRLGRLFLRAGGLLRGHLPENALDADGPLVRVVDRRLHHPHENGLPARGLVGFDDVQGLAGLEDARVVLAVLPGEALREQVEVRRPEELLRGSAHRAAVLTVRVDDAAVEVLAEEVLGQIVDQRAVQRVGAADFLLRLQEGA